MPGVGAGSVVEVVAGREVVFGEGVLAGLVRGLFGGAVRDEVDGPVGGLDVGVEFDVADVGGHGGVRPPGLAPRCRLLGLRASVRGSLVGRRWRPVRLVGGSAGLGDPIGLGEAFV